MQPNPPQRHHYIPKFYLKRWANSDGKVVEYKKIQSGEIIHKEKALKAVGKRENLYALPKGNPLNYQTQVIESEFFGQLDNNAADCLKTLESASEIPNDPDFRYNWAMFILSLKLRTPTGVAMIRETLRKSINSNDIEEQSELDLLENLIMAQLTKLIASEKSLPRIVELNWSVGVFNSVDSNSLNHQLLLSDCPITWSPLDKPMGRIILPLSPTKYFVATKSTELLGRLKNATIKDTVNAINKQTVSNAQEFVVATNSKKSPFVENHFGKSKGGRLTDMIKEHAPSK